MTTHKLIIGDVMKVLSKIESNSVDTVMTSPPYYGLRDYGIGTESLWNKDKNCEHTFGNEIIQRSFGGVGNNANVGNQKNNVMNGHEKKGQFCTKCNAWYGKLGLEPTLGLFIEHLIEVFSEIKRVLKPTGSFYLNLGDCYAGHKGFDNLAYGGKPHNDIKNHTTTHLPAKCLTLLPSRVAIALIDDGWILRNDIIWTKPNHMPSSVKDRLTNSYEHIFHFVKQRKYHYDLDEIRVPHKVCGVTDKRPMGILRQKLYEGSAYHKSDDPHLKQYQGKFEGKGEDAENYGSPRARTQRKGANTGDNNKEPYKQNNPHRIRLKQDNVPSKNASLYKGFNKRWKDDEDKNTKGKNPSDTWIMTTEPYPKAHFATYPQKICVRPIKSSCPPNGIVLDPFAGSGTTAKVARELGRNSISIDINPDSKGLWWKRVSAGESLDDTFEVEVVE